MSIPDPNARTFQDPQGRIVVATEPPPAVVMPAPPAAVVVEQVGAPVASVPVVYEPVVAAPAVRTNVLTTSRQRYAFDSLVVGLAGLFFTIIGLLAVTRAGFDGSMDDPVIDVLGFTHTVRLGLIEAVIGVCLLISAAATSRSGAVFFGLVLGIGGAVGAMQTSSFERSLALESGLAWIAVVAAIIVVAVSLLVPRMVTQSERVESNASRSF